VAELRKEERLFIELARRAGALDDVKIARAREAARSGEVSVVEALVSGGALGLDAADRVRRELLELSFTCPGCEGLDFREIGEPKTKGRLCGECQAAQAKTGASPAAPVTVGGRKTEVAPPEPEPRAPTAPAPGAPPPAPGEGEELAAGVVLGGCRIERRIGQGGMGRVYKGHHDGLDRDMAVKVIDERLVAKKGFVEQFLAEARTLAKLDHANVVRVFNVDQDVTGRRFILMELLEGGSVEALWREKGVALPIDDAVKIADEAAQGLLHAHEAGLIHRDVKPGNLMLTKRGPGSELGRVKVVDFGLAARTENDVFIATEIAGTPHYMAPEQVDGLRLDARCDQYALGATLFQLVCGRPPFQGKRAFELLAAHMNEPPPEPRTLRADAPEWLESVILKMLAKRPQDRFASLKDVVAALESKGGAALAPEAPARPKIHSADIVKLASGLKPRPVTPPAWRPWAAAAAAFLVAALLSVFVPLKEALGGADLGVGAVPGFVAKIGDEARARAASGRAEDLAASLASLEQAIQDLGSRPGAAALARVRDELAAEKAALAGRTEAALSKETAELLEKKRPWAVLDLAQPGTGSLAALGLEKKALEWRKAALDALAARGEVYVPAGPYSAGESGEPARLEGFYIDRTEVTNADWAALMDSQHLERPASWPTAGPLPRELARRPVTGVSIEAARLYARALGKRLPRSAEWEKAARGPADARAWPWGPRFEPGRANLLDGGGAGLEDVDLRQTDASPYGVLGLAGNAMEWVEGEEGPLVAGGASRSHALSGRVFARMKLEAPRDAAVGFRCARDLER